LSAPRSVGKLIACIDAIAVGYQTVLLHRQSDVAEPTSPSAARDAIEGKRAGRCFIPAGIKQRSLQSHAVAAKRRATSWLTKLVFALSRYLGAPPLTDPNDRGRACAAMIGAARSRTGRPIITDLLLFQRAYQTRCCGLKGMRTRVTDE